MLKKYRLWERRTDVQDRRQRARRGIPSEWCRTSCRCLERTSSWIPYCWTCFPWQPDRRMSRTFPRVATMNPRWTSFQRSSVPQKFCKTGWCRSAWSSASWCSVWDSAWWAALRVLVCVAPAITVDTVFDDCRTVSLWRLGSCNIPTVRRCTVRSEREIGWWCCVSSFWCSTIAIASYGSAKRYIYVYLRNTYAVDAISAETMIYERDTSTIFDDGVHFLLYSHSTQFYTWSIACVRQTVKKFNETRTKGEINSPDVRAVSEILWEIWKMYEKCWKYSI